MSTMVRPVPTRSSSPPRAAASATAAAPSGPQGSWIACGPERGRQPRREIAAGEHRAHRSRSAPPRPARTAPSSTATASPVTRSTPAGAVEQPGEVAPVVAPRHIIVGTVALARGPGGEMAGLAGQSAHVAGPDVEQMAGRGRAVGGAPGEVPALLDEDDPGARRGPGDLHRRDRPRISRPDDRHPHGRALAGEPAARHSRESGGSRRPREAVPGTQFETRLAEIPAAWHRLREKSDSRPCPPAPPVAKPVLPWRGSFLSPAAWSHRLARA